MENVKLIKFIIFFIFLLQSQVFLLNSMDNEELNTNLLFAIQKENPDLEGIQILISKGADLNKVKALSKAIPSFNLELVQLLLQNNAYPIKFSFRRLQKGKPLPSIKTQQNEIFIFVFNDDDELKCKQMYNLLENWEKYGEEYKKSFNKLQLKLLFYLTKHKNLPREIAKMIIEFTKKPTFMEYINQKQNYILPNVGLQTYNFYSLSELDNFSE